MASRWYIIGKRPGSEKIEILGWSRDKIAALGRQGVIAVYYASSRKAAAGMARRDRGFEIDWRKF
jgi:hypothetical protein